MQNTDFTAAQLLTATFDDAILLQCDFTRSEPGLATFLGTVLIAPVWDGANLKSADLDGAVRGGAVRGRSGCPCGSRRVLPQKIPGRNFRGGQPVRIGSDRRAGDGSGYRLLDQQRPRMASDPDSALRRRPATLIMRRIRTRHRIIPRPAPRMAPANPVHHQITTSKRAVPFKRLQRINAAGRLKPATMSDPWR